MRDPRLDTLAAVLVQYSAAVKKGDLVTIVGDPGAMGAVEAIFEAVLRAGGHPSFHPRSDRLMELLLRHGSDEQIKHVSPFEEHRLAICDVLLVLKFEENTRFLGKVDSKKVAMLQATRRGLITNSLKRGAEGKMRYLLAEIPSTGAAQDAGMSLADYEDFVYRAGFLHLPDPVAAWRALHEQQQRACEYLKKKGTLRFQAPARDGDDGTDLTVDVAGRKWTNHSGQQNMPDGEVESGPRSAEGVVNFTYPVTYRGKRMEGVRLKFKGGRVVEASAEKGEDYLISLLDQDDGARGIGEIAIGTNYELKESVSNVMFDEKIGGSFHLAVGAGFPETGSTNESALHMDLVCDLRSGGTIEADGELVQRDGRFVFSGWPGRGR